ncbi:hypothetical protein HHJ81_09090 [Mobiluncus mulieris]|uniref:hypothetical protein n=1 Tax=Mobiluncus mulieris TaxID=2052 RepID=UPI00146FE8CD|nr:hypothetical protein [Mobiluncus mulieris]NMW61234.1 hypothetical protein [Mobiluncus mulieris]
MKPLSFHEVPFATLATHDHPKAITKIELTKTTGTETAVTSILRYLLLYPGQG